MNLKEKTMDDDAILTRAIQAYYKRGPNMQYLSRDNCEVKQHKGVWYAVLRNTTELRGLYEINGDPNGAYQLVGLFGLDEVPKGLA